MEETVPFHRCELLRFYEKFGKNSASCLCKNRLRSRALCQINANRGGVGVLETEVRSGAHQIDGLLVRCIGVVDGIV